MLSTHSRIYWFQRVETVQNSAKFCDVAFSSSLFARSLLTAERAIEYFGSVVCRSLKSLFEKSESAFERGHFWGKYLENPMVLTLKGSSNGFAAYFSNKLLDNFFLFQTGS